jgi:hypothetical protein
VSLILFFRTPWFSHKPYKWIRYAIGVVVGAEGDLSTSPDSFVSVDVDAVLPAVSVDLCYHPALEERKRMFPIDPSGERTHITSSVNFSQRSDFCVDVGERDRRRCLLSGMKEIFCDAVHILPLSKGDAVC